MVGAIAFFVVLLVIGYMYLFTGTKMKDVIKGDDIKDVARRTFL